MSSNIQPLYLDISLIDEDPNQPRKCNNKGFSKEKLEELAQTIKERGVKSPISVRESGNGRYIINHGARRYRASIIAEKQTIPVFIDNDYSKLDQVIENIQREELSPREIADYIGYRLAGGIKKKDLATELGKSNSWLSQYTSLLTMPEAIAEAMTQGKINDLTAINELIKLYNQNPVDIGAWIKEEKEISRATISVMKDYINSLNSTLDEELNSSINKEVNSNIRKKQGTEGPKPKVIVKYQDTECEIKMKRTEDNKIIVVFPSGETKEVFVTDVTLVGIK